MPTTREADFWGKTPDAAPAEMSARQRLIFDTLSKALLDDRNGHDGNSQYVCFGAATYPGEIILDGQFRLDRIARAVDEAIAAQGE